MCPSCHSRSVLNRMCETFQFPPPRKALRGSSQRTLWGNECVLEATLWACIGFWHQHHHSCPGCRRPFQASLLGHAPRCVCSGRRYRSIGVRFSSYSTNDSTTITTPVLSAGVHRKSFVWPSRLSGGRSVKSRPSLSRAITCIFEGVSD